MPDTIPAWAGKRACELLNAEPRGGGWLWPQNGRHHCVVAVAKLVMQTEQPPADPLLLEARKIVAEQNREQNPPRFAKSVDDGEFDEVLEMRIALAALRRGFEIGKESR